MERSKFFGLCAAGMCIGLAGSAVAQCYGPKIVDDNPNGLSHMGATCELTGNYLVLGAPSFGANGRINIFEREDGVWEEAAEFASPVAPNEDGYARSLALSGLYLAVGAPLTDVGADAQTGRVYIYHRSVGGWSLVETIENPSPDDDDYFGHSVDMRSIGGTPVLAIGSPGDDLPGAAGAGTVRIYYREMGSGDWVFHSTVSSTDIDTNEFFGGSVALGEDHLVVGAPGEDFSGLVDAGAAYVYNRSGYSFISGTRFIGPSGERQSNDTYGYSVAITDDRIAVGVPADDEGAATDCGSICIYNYNGVSWSFDERVLQSTPDSFNRIGDAIDIHGDVLVAGAASSEEAYLWRRTVFATWPMDTTFVASDPPASGSHNFGSSVSLSTGGNHLLVGDSGDDIGGQGNSGSAYFFTTDTNGVEDCDGSPAHPTPFVTSGTYFGCSGETTDGLTLCAPTSHDAYYQFTAPCDGILRLSTCGTNDLYGEDTGIDTVLSVQQGCAVVSPIACNDDFDAGNYSEACFLSGDFGDLRDSALRINVNAGENYKIRVASYGAAGDPGQFILNVEFSCCRVDWDGNGIVNSTDVSEFINDWFEDQAFGTLNTDFDNNGISNSTDVGEFINAWFEGCKV